MLPNHWLPHHELSGVLAAHQDLEEARTEGERAVAHSGGASVAVARLACICSLQADEKRGGELLDLLERRSREAYVAPSFFGWVHLARQESARALARLRQASALKDPWLSFTRLYVGAFCRLDPPVQELLREAGW
jgi:hypothetical protein